MSAAALNGIDTYLLRFSDLADFVIAMGEKKIGVWPTIGTSIETLRHLLLDQVLPRVLAQQGKGILHAGAVKIGDEAVAFVGETGSGKSTLAASFNTANFPLLSDDSLILTTNANQVFCLAAYPCLRLWPEGLSRIYNQAPDVVPMAHYSTKQRVVLKDARIFTKKPVRLSSIYLLEQEPFGAANTISDRRFSPAEACIQIIRNSFQLNVTDPVRGAAMLEWASKIAETVPVFAIFYRRSYSIIPEIVNYIIGKQSSLDKTYQELN